MPLPDKITEGQVRAAIEILGLDYDSLQQLRIDPVRVEVKFESDVGGFPVRLVTGKATYRWPGEH